MNLQTLYDIIEARKAEMPEGSYTTYLFQQGRDKILKKVGEESAEVIIAASGQGKERLVEEISDLAYHVLVLMAQQDITPQDIAAELEKRHR
ncbi:MAG: phosphoribosyl-ATP diphosphatase [Anaerolineae bacterium]|jgi:phosphoribosyl-ATP pyrophosphohydrolase/phosphoribosyl-AMP cyclohydrolase|nr:phosphoribosyl-ATP diphosphatase [Anaerolineae bacterium]